MKFPCLRNTGAAVEQERRPGVRAPLVTLRSRRQARRLVAPVFVDEEHGESCQKWIGLEDGQDLLPVRILPAPRAVAQLVGYLPAEEIAEPQHARFVPRYSPL